MPNKIKEKKYGKSYWNNYQPRYDNRRIKR